MINDFSEKSTEFEVAQLLQGAAVKLWKGIDLNCQESSR